MFNDQIAKLEKAKADVQQLEAKIAVERVAALVTSNPAYPRG